MTISILFSFRGAPPPFQGMNGDGFEFYAAGACPSLGKLPAGSVLAVGGTTTEKITSA